MLDRDILKNRQVMTAFQGGDRLSRRGVRARSEEHDQLLGQASARASTTAGNQEWREGCRRTSAWLAAPKCAKPHRHSLRLQLSRKMRRINKRLPFLATVGFVGTLIGLFGNGVGHHEHLHSASPLGARHQPRHGGIAEA